MEYMQALAPMAAVPVAVGFASIPFPDLHGQVVDVHAEPWRVETTTEVPTLSVPSIDRGTRTHLAGVAITACDLRRGGRRNQRWSVNT
jgi:hypothetical protein